MNGSNARDRSPLRQPPTAHMNYHPSQPTFVHQQSDPSFDPALYDQTLAQQLNDNTFDAFATNTISSNNFDPSLVDDYLSPNTLSNHTSPAQQHDQLNFPTFDLNTDPTLINELDLLQQQGSLNGGHHTLNTMSAVTNSPTPPHLLAHASNSPSPHASPAGQSAAFAQMGRPRNTSESLDPSSAAFPTRSSGDWTGAAFRGHRRVHSDNLSDISSHSNQASPYLATLDSFDTASHASPLLNAQDPMLGDALGIGQFNLNDQIAQQSFHTPGHSPHISPRLMPQQPLPAFTPADNFGLTLDINNQMFGAQPSFQPNDGLTEHMSPPEINIDFAPTQRPLNAPPAVNTLMDNSLTPPLKTNRTRAKSASYVDSRPTTPALQSRGRSPSLTPGLSAESLSPFSVSNPSSRNTSPRGRASSLSNRARSTSATSGDRDYILDLADPERNPGNGGDSRRAQKHPATFQCHLCPKRFTRAYNLRSHLRTHTDERPFVCTVCGKAFARQHDRKRHEGLHSGEKKFVCRGPLKNGEQWGCSRRFARADALGRHFRSEAGRVCIRPLLEEEAAEQQQQVNSAAWMEQQSATYGQPGMDYNSSSFLPARLLEQYPALAGIDWASAAAQGNGDDDGYGGRSSFDHSSGGEMYDDLSEGEFVDPGAAMGLGVNQNIAAGFGQQRQQAMGGFGSHQMGDYANGFEGR